MKITTVLAAAQPASHPVEAPTSSIPWSQVGPGWLLATWTPTVSHRPGVKPAPGEPDPATAATTLYLVDPTGVRYPMTTFSPPTNRATPELVDWTTNVDVPGTQGSVEVIGATDADLYLHADVGCGGGVSLIDYNPATNTSTVLLGPPVNGGGVIDEVPYRGQKK